MAGKRKADDMEGSNTSARMESRFQSVHPTKRAKYGSRIFEQYAPAWHMGTRFKIDTSPVKSNFTEGRFRPPRGPVRQA